MKSIEKLKKQALVNPSTIKGGTSKAKSADKLMQKMTQYISS